MRWWWRWCFWIRSLQPFSTSTTIGLASANGQWEFGVSYLLIFFRYWHFVSLLEETVGWLSMWQCRPLIYVCSTTWFGIFKTLLRWWRIVSLRSLEGSSADVLLVGSRSRRQRRVAIAVFKALFGRGVCRYPFSFLSLHCSWIGWIIGGGSFNCSKSTKNQAVLITTVLCGRSFCWLIFRLWQAVDQFGL